MADENQPTNAGTTNVDTTNTGTTNTGTTNTGTTNTGTTNAGTTNAGTTNAVIGHTAAHTSFQKLYEKIVAAVEDLTTLTVITAVGEVTITETTTDVNGEKRKSRTEQCSNAKAIVSKIDLVDGDIETCMDVVFVSDNAAYSKIRDDHILRIKDAHDIVDKNVKALKEMVNTVKDILATTKQQAEQK